MQDFPEINDTVACKTALRFCFHSFFVNLHSQDIANRIRLSHHLFLDRYIYMITSCDIETNRQIVCFRLTHLTIAVLLLLRAATRHR